MSETPVSRALRVFNDISNLTSSSTSLPVDTTSTPMLKMRDKKPGSRSPFLSPISHGSEFSPSTSSLLHSIQSAESGAKESLCDIQNIWCHDEDSFDEKSDSLVSESGYVTKSTKSEWTETTGFDTVDDQVAKGNEKLEFDFSAPLQISIPSPRLKSDPPSPRQEMFMALDRNFYRYLKLMKTDRFVIGRLVGQQYCDVLNAMDDYDRSGFLISHHFLPLLSPSTLRKMRLVNRKWKEIVTRLSKGRWKETMISSDQLSLGKENFGTPLLSSEDGSGGMVRKGPMQSIQRLGESPVGELSFSPEPIDKATESTNDAQWRRFMFATSQLRKSEYLGRCPICCGPARIHPPTRKAVCTDKSCGYVHCTLCYYSYHDDKPCQRKISPTRDTSPHHSPEKRLTKKRLKRL